MWMVWPSKTFLNKCWLSFWYLQTLLKYITILKVLFLFFSEWSLEIKKSTCDGLNPIDRLNSATYLCLTLSRPYIMIFVSRYLIIILFFLVGCWRSVSRWYDLDTINWFNAVTFVYRIYFLSTLVVVISVLRVWRLTGWRVLSLSWSGVYH